MLFYLDSIERMFFFHRFAKTCSALNYESHFITIRPSIYILSRYQGQTTHLIKRSKTTRDFDIKHSIEFLTGIYSEEQAREVANSVNDFFNENFVPERVECIHIWNGQKVANQSLSEWCERNRVSKLYWEITNIPGKVQVDPMGTNAQSSIFANPEILDQYPDSQEAFQHWKNAYLENRSKSHSAPQSKQKTNINLWSILDYWAGKVGWTPPYEQFSFTKRLWSKLRNRAAYNFPFLDNLSSRAFYFYPMQIRSDTQLLINSKIDNMEAIRSSASIAANASCELLVNPHPAEIDREYVKQITEEISRISNLQLVSNNTFDLIAHSKKVLTVNSSVGLEALIQGKEVQFLGKSIYHKLSPSQLAAYITDHLINIDYFEKDIPVPSSEFQRALSYTNLSIN